MALSRALKNAERKAKAPAAGTKQNATVKSEVKPRQYQQTGKKYSGPNYIQRKKSAGEPIEK